MFKFYDLGKLIDNDLELVLVKEYRGDPIKGYVPSYKFKMILTGQDEEIGQIIIRVGNTNHIVMYAGHIGYTVHKEHRGNRYAAKACKLLIPLARKHELNPLWIKCNPENIPSRRTCEILGAKMIEIVNLPKNTNMYIRGERHKCRYRLDL